MTVPGVTPLIALAFGVTIAQPGRFRESRDIGAHLGLTRRRDGIQLVSVPPYAPELQPLETLWALVDEPIVSTHLANRAELKPVIATPNHA